MPLLNTFKSDGDDARAQLDHGESLLALSPAVVSYGVTTGPRGAEPDLDAIDAKVNEQKALSTWRTILLFPFALLAAGPSWGGPKDFPESWIGGRTCEGPPGSAARDVQRIVRANHDSYVAVTDRRLILLTRDGFDAPMTVAWAVPRSSVPGARHRPRLLARARYELRFADGSWIILSACPPHLGHWHARQVADALVHPA